MAFEDKIKEHEARRKRAMAMGGEDKLSAIVPMPRESALARDLADQGHHRARRVAILPRMIRPQRLSVFRH